jgi:hypothetical protein
MSTHPSTPPPSSPAGVPQAGNAKYAIVAILLVLGMGGLFAWKSMSSQPPPPPPIVVMPSASTTAATTNAKLDDIPPPPPEEIKPEAGAGPKIVYVPGAAGGCEKSCSGTATPELTAALQMRGAQAKRCYNQALASDSTLKGHVAISVKIGGGGTACSAGVASNDMGSPAVANCAASIFRNASYPAPKGGCLDVNVPLSFVPQGQ